MDNNVLKLPKFFRPLHKTNLVRIGKDNDGGYLIGEESINNTKILQSFGVNDDWSFEEDFFNRTNAQIYCYDPTVDWKFWVKRLLRDLKNVLLFRKKNLKELSDIFIYFKYLKFFNNSKKVHLKKFISPIGIELPNLNQNDIIDINTLVRNQNDKNIFFKIDIEGSEYRILDQLIKHHNCMTGLVIEFHNCDLHYELIHNFIKNFDLQLVHLHVNNWGLINENRFPSSLEITFSPKDFNTTLDDQKFSLPISLDQPCNPLIKDCLIEFLD